MKSVNPFIVRMPGEMPEQYMTDCMMEFVKMAEKNKTTDDSVISHKYGLIVAFARKS